MGDQLLTLLGQHLHEAGLKVISSTIVDASIISARSLTKNRDSHKHQTKKGNQWCFGIQAHIGVDSRTKLSHSVAATAANMHDIEVLSDLLHGQEAHVWDESAYRRQREAAREPGPEAKDFANKKGSRFHALTEEERAKNRTKSRGQRQAEHRLRVLKRLFVFTKARYRGLDKNAQWLLAACSLLNLYQARRILLRSAQGARA